MASSSCPIIAPLLCIFCTILTFSCLSANTSSPVILPLLKSNLAVANTPNKLSFHHNVSLTLTLAVGSPPQPATMVLDTGSELSWLNCAAPAAATNFKFNPRLSTSYRPIPCSSPTCTVKTRDFTLPVSCDNHTNCHVIVSYADASSVEGTLASDTFRLPGTMTTTTVFGCMDSGSSSNPDEDSKSTGLIGMNRGALSFVTQTGIRRFSYCISSRDSSGALVLGEADFPWLPPLNYTPLIQMPTPLPYFDRIAYTVQLLQIRVANTVLPLPKSILEPDHTGAGQTMLDSGTQFTFLLGPAYAALKKEFTKQTNGILHPVAEPGFAFEGTMDICYKAEITTAVVSALPSVSLVLGGAEMKVAGEKLVYKAREGVFCLTFGNSDLLGVEAYVIGHHHQEDVWMEFDLAKSRVGMGAVRCDLAGQRLGLG